MKSFIKTIFKSLGYKINKIETLSSKMANYPIEMSKEERDLVSICEPISMTPPIRMWSVIQAANHVKNNNISGDFVECGVWRGGNLVLMKKLSENLNLNNAIYGYDTFEGMSDPTFEDKDYLGNLVKDYMDATEKKNDLRDIHAYCELDNVTNNLKERSVDIDSNLHLIKGPVEETLLKDENLPKSIAILRLDTDWYESTKIELEVLYPRLERGGVLIIDDYGHYKGSQKAVDDYFKSIGKKPWLHFVDYTCRLYIKN